jgi:hypothetical protein
MAAFGCDRPMLGSRLRQHSEDDTDSFVYRLEFRPPLPVALKAQKPLKVCADDLVFDEEPVVTERR